MLSQLVDVGSQLAEKGLGGEMGSGGTGTDQSSAASGGTLTFTSGSFGKSEWSDLVPIIALVIVAVIWIKKG